MNDFASNLARRVESVAEIRPRIQSRFESPENLVETVSFDTAAPDLAMAEQPSAESRAFDIGPRAQLVGPPLQVSNEPALHRDDSDGAPVDRLAAPTPTPITVEPNEADHHPTGEVAPEQTRQQPDLYPGLAKRLAALHELVQQIDRRVGAPVDEEFDRSPAVSDPTTPKIVKELQRETFNHTLVERDRPLMGEGNRSPSTVAPSSPAPMDRSQPIATPASEGRFERQTEGKPQEPRRMDHSRPRQVKARSNPEPIQRSFRQPSVQVAAPLTGNKSKRVFPQVQTEKTRPELAAEAATQQRTINIKIGHVEVRTASPKQSQSSPPATSQVGGAKVMSLSEYVQRRMSGGIG